MFIQTETTPNPATLKFIPGESVLGSSTANFNSKEEAVRSPLATALFDINGIEAVFLGSDFISVTKNQDNDWSHLKTEVLTTIMEHYVAGKPVMSGDGSKASAESNEDDDEIVKQIKELIETRVRPSVAQDGGDIIFHGFENGIVKLEMHGACSGCPSSTITLKNGIENMLKHYVPEVESVEAIEI
ncbi:MAG: NifU family protein [Rickettsiales bacterium]|nr:NifU family protein [Pseudomonadota bacterium]MDA0965896.1 NifU family protein [Pseudomonadota bacterium]MDG4542634.1 NifU family protein [Rickettsiales bacterium]MDG4545138.1 NifU family protein [Rickettsiales bacterium]MDG4547261.1 NifU family protein [Rickettsiales bacterium]